MAGRARQWLRRKALGLARQLGVGAKATKPLRLSETELPVFKGAVSRLSTSIPRLREKGVRGAEARGTTEGAVLEAHRFATQANAEIMGEAVRIAMDRHHIYNPRIRNDLQRAVQEHYRSIDDASTRMLEAKTSAERSAISHEGAKKAEAAAVALRYALKRDLRFSKRQEARFWDDFARIDNALHFWSKLHIISEALGKMGITKEEDRRRIAGIVEKIKGARSRKDVIETEYCVGELEDVLRKAGLRPAQMDEIMELLGTTSEMKAFLKRLGSSPEKLYSEEFTARRRAP